VTRWLHSLCHQRIESDAEVQGEAALRDTAQVHGPHLTLEQHTRRIPQGSARRGRPVRNTQVTRPEITSAHRQHAENAFAPGQASGHFAQGAVAPGGNYLVIALAHRLGRQARRVTRCRRVGDGHPRSPPGEHIRRLKDVLMGVPQPRGRVVDEHHLHARSIPSPPLRVHTLSCRLPSSANKLMALCMLLSCHLIHHTEVQEYGFGPPLWHAPATALE